MRKNNIRPPADSKEGLAGNVGVTMRQRTSETKERTKQKVGP